MRFFFSAATVGLLTLTGAALAQTVPAAATPPSLANHAPKAHDSGWVFSLLPKSLQKNPRLDLTVITEMTDEGKKLPPASPEHPVYFEALAGGYKALGEQVGGEKPFPEKEITNLLLKSLAASGYLPAKLPEHPPTLFINYIWGTHNLLNEADPENPSLSPAAVERNLLDRAALVGGAKFAAHLKELFEQADAQATANYTPPSDPTGLVPDRQPILGAEQMAFMNPVELFKRQSTNNEFLVDQAASDVYFVVASAYDYRAMGQHQRVLLWRTRMTVATEGVSQELSLPTLVLTAGPYFGKEMDGAEIISKRAVRDGSVEIGTPIVVEPAAEGAVTPTKPATKK